MSNKIRIWQNYWAIFYTFFTFDCETALWNMSVCMMSVWSFWLIFKMSKSNRRAHILFNIPIYIFLQTCSIFVCNFFADLFIYFSFADLFFTFFAMFLSDKIVQQNFYLLELYFITQKVTFFVQKELCSPFWMFESSIKPLWKMVNYKSKTSCGTCQSNVQK